MLDHKDTNINAALNAWDRRNSYKINAEGVREKASTFEMDSTWETMWTAVDFSWSGVAGGYWDKDFQNIAEELKRWHPPTTFPNLSLHKKSEAAKQIEATLQDYWRWSMGLPGHEKEGKLLSDDELIELGLLVEYESKLWHIIHRPETDISEHPILITQIISRLSAAWDYQNNGQDLYTLLIGARARGVDTVLRQYSLSQTDKERKTLYISAQLADLSGSNFSGLTFGNDAKFNRAKFGVGTDFSDTQFSDRTSFYSAQFDDGTMFSNAVFGRSTGFTKAHFGEYIAFNSVQFIGDVSFSEAQFGDKVSFIKSKYAGAANFEHSQFGDDLLFDIVIFEEIALFSNVKVGRDACFKGAQFREDTTFSQAALGEATSFEGAQFEAMVTFASARLGNGTSFDNCEFTGKAYFLGLQLSGKASWSTANFKDFVSFKDTNWQVSGRGVHHGRAFDATRFRDIANFETNYPFYAFAAFDGASFQGKLLLTDPSDTGGPEARFVMAVTAVNDTIDEEIALIQANEKRSRLVRRERREVKARCWGELSGGYRTVKSAVEKEGDFERAQRYYRYEVQARIRKPTTRWPERLAAGFYDLFSDYGASIGRPFVGLTLFLIIFAATYFAIEFHLGAANINLSVPTNQAEVESHAIYSAEDIWEALEFSLNNAFRPLSALAVQEPSGNTEPQFAAKLLYEYGGGWGLIVRALAILQSLLSLVLAFLFGLAMRRRFQIS
ncbi:MAG: pentapeptide repeat-containing protein [Pseudomonadota bacterium]